MRKSRFTESQIIEILNEPDAGVPVKELWRKHGISAATFYKWKAKYGGMDVNQLKRVKELEGENAGSVFGTTDERSLQEIGVLQSP